jgi:predicted dehydrogenase
VTRRPTVHVVSRHVRVADDATPLRVALFGAGKAARFHLEAIDQMHGVTVTGICSRSGTSAERLASGRPLVLTSADPSDLLDPDRFDAAIVAVDHDHTAELTRRVLSAGIPVLAEKPAAATSAEVDELARHAASTGTLATVGVNRRYYSLLAAALLTVRERGPIQGVLVEAHEPTDLLRHGGSIDAHALRRWFLLDAVHYVDLLRHIGGEVETVVGVGSADPASPGSRLSASIAFEDGVLGTFVSHWNSAAPQIVRIYGQHATAEVRLSRPEHGFVEFTGGRRVKLSSDPVDSWAKPGVYAQDTAFLLAVASGNPPAPPASDLGDHARTLRLVEQLLAASGSSPTS